MKGIIRGVKGLLKTIENLSLADKFLLVFMFLLLAQMGHNLFFNELGKENSSVIDTAIRTTAAAIFGYFISVGFLGEEEEQGQVSATDESQVEIDTRREYKRKKRQQITIVGLVGVLSLLLIVIVRNVGEVNQFSISTLTQLRDFLSSSVGCLVGLNSRD